MIDLSKLRAPGWQRVVAELTNPAPDDRAFLMRLLAVLAQAAGARQAVLFAAGVTDDDAGAEVEPRALAVWPMLPDQERSGQPVADTQVDRARECKAAVREAAIGAKVAVFGLEDETPFYESSHKGYLIAAPLSAGTESPAGVRHVVTLLLDQRSQQALQTTAALVELMCGYTHGHAANQLLRRTRASSIALDLATRLIASINTAPNFKGAGLQLVNDLSRQLGADRVALGWAKGIGRKGEGATVKTVAISDTELIDRRMAMVQKLEAAMDECFDQDQPVLYPQPPERASQPGEDADVLLAQAITHAHRELATADAKLKIASLPLRVDEDVVGVVTVESTGEGRIDLAMLELLQSTMDLIAPVLALRRSDDRNVALRSWDATLEAGAWLVGTKHTVWKLAGVAVVAVALAVTLVHVEYRIEAPVTLRAEEQRTISVPFDGIIASVPEGIESGEPVEAGQVLAELDTTELKLQRLEAVNQLAEATKKADAALTAGKLDEYSQTSAQIEQYQSKIDLFDLLIEKAVIRSPISGTIIEGDLKEMIGASVKLGQALFMVAPVDRMVMVARVSDKDVALISSDPDHPTTGDLATKAFPGQRFPFAVERIVPQANPDEDRRNAFEVRAKLTKAAGWMRPGMEGLAKFNTGKRSLLDIGTRRIRDTLRLWLWW
ncbi:MAG: efflux RND transporter periplasmic adaptor subunit [Phycisphaerales bacterium]|nr:efflux RND transporter periplasmic adaptor subunit [Phycisphaerales bacterium]